MVLYAMFNVLLSYKMKRMRGTQALLRAVIWTAILGCLWFAHPITDYLRAHDLTDSPPLSVFDVLLTTGIIGCLILLARGHGRLRLMEEQFTRLQEELAIELSERPRHNRQK
jgi:hypothetical protein